MSTTTDRTTVSTVSTGTALKTGLAAGVVAAILNVFVSAVARGPFDAGDDFVPLTPGPIVFWTLVGGVVGAIGWRLIVNEKADSRGLLDRLVPTVLVLSLIPDVALLGIDSMPGHSTAAVVALMVMHVLTAAVVVTAYRKAMPPR